MNDRNTREFVAALGAAVALAGCNRTGATDGETPGTDAESGPVRRNARTNTPTPERTRPTPTSTAAAPVTETPDRVSTTATATPTATPSRTATPTPVSTEGDDGASGGGGPATGGTASGSSGGGTGGESGETTESGDATEPQPTATATPTPGPLDLREANVVDVETTRLQDGRHMFAVSLHHDDAGEDGHADAWRVETHEGGVLGRFTIGVPHDDQQPFTSLGRIAIPEGEDCVVVRGHDATHGFGGQAMGLSLATGETTAVRQGPSKESLAAIPCPDGE